MRFCFIDLETTGLDTSKDEATQVAWVIKDIDCAKPVVIKNHYVRTVLPVNEKLFDLTKITEHLLDVAGKPLATVFADLCLDVSSFKVDYFVAHNGSNFDKPLCESLASRFGVSFPSLPWIDTRYDLPYLPSWTSKKLHHLAAEIGFVNPFSHDALFDCFTTIRLFEYYPLEDVLRYNREPWLTLKACVSYEDRDKAKARRFSWEKLEGRTFPKTWVKRIKAHELDEERHLSEFDIVVLEKEEPR